MLEFFGEAQPLVPLLLRLSYIIRQPSRHPAYRLPIAVALLHNLIDYLAASAELGWGDNSEVFESSDHIQMPEIYREGSKWPRRMTRTLPLRISQAVAAQPSLRNAQQLLAARQVCMHGARQEGTHRGKGLQKRGVKKAEGLGAAAGRTRRAEHRRNC